MGIVPVAFQTRAGQYLHMRAIKQEFGVDAAAHEVEHAAVVFGMLADETRIRLILALADSGELSVNHLAEIVDKTPAAVSQHLAKLRLARVVTNRRQGTTIFYALTDEHAIDLVRNALLQAEHSFDAHPRHHEGNRS